MAAKSASTLFLFTNEDGSPMVFVVTPGDTKKRLRPIVESGGGLLTSKDTPGAIRLVAPDCEAGKQLVCSDFVFDSYKNGKLCNIDDYRLESKPASPKSHVTVKSEKALKSGRIKYRPEEDQAILDYIKKFKGHVKLSGNKIWQEMEEKNVTCHRWQSMRSRYLSFLRQSTRTSSFKGKLEFLGRKKSSRSQTTGNNNTVDNVSACMITEPNSHSLQNDGKVNEEGKDKENVHASLPNEQQTLTSLNHHHDENVQQNLETMYLGKKQNAKTSNESESQTIEVEDVYVTSCTSPIVGTSSTASCEKKNQQDDTDVSESNIQESPKSCHTGIRKCFKAQTKDITSDKVADKSGSEHIVVPQYNKGDTTDFNHGNKNSANDCVPVLKRNQLFENFRKLQMISSMCPTQAQILHALYVSCGCLECALYYLHKGLLPNGKVWTREEDAAISSGDVTAIKKIVDKRGPKAVNDRKQFLSSF